MLTKPTITSIRQPIMGLFSRDKQPGWSAITNKDEYSLFREKLLAASNGEIDANKADKAGVLQTPEGVAMNISNLTYLCKDLTEVELDKEITRWLGAYTDNREEPELLYPRDLHMLRLQLYPDDYFQQIAEDFKPLCYQEIPGIKTAVVIDWPNSLASMEESPGWVEHKREIRIKLQKKLESEEPYPVNFSEIGKNGLLAGIIAGDAVTAATHALALSKLYPDVIGDNGALVGLPFRHMIITRKLQSDPTPEELQEIAHITRYMFEENAPYSLSEKVYHYRDGTFSAIA